MSERREFCLRVRPRWRRALRAPLTYRQLRAAGSSPLLALRLTIWGIRL